MKMIIHCSLAHHYSKQPSDEGLNDAKWFSSLGQVISETLLCSQIALWWWFTSVQSVKKKTSTKQIHDQKLHSTLWFGGFWGCLAPPLVGKFENTCHLWRPMTSRPQGLTGLNDMFCNGGFLGFQDTQEMKDTTTKNIGSRPCAPVFCSARREKLLGLGNTVPYHRCMPHKQRQVPTSNPSWTSVGKKR